MAIPDLLERMRERERKKDLLTAHSNQIRDKRRKKKLARAHL